MSYTRRKVRGINLSFLLAGFIFACWAFFCAWSGWPRSLHGGSTVGFALFGAAAVFFSAFPLIWTRNPKKHPVYHELHRYGKTREVAARLDREMAGPVETLGPFHFTETMLIYDAGLEFQLIPYEHIVAAEISTDDVPCVSVRTRSGRKYQWFRSWMQGVFNPDEVLQKIQTLMPKTNHEPAASKAGPTSVPSASQSPSEPGSPGSAQ